MVFPYGCLLCGHDRAELPGGASAAAFWTRCQEWCLGLFGHPTASRETCRPVLRESLASPSLRKQVESVLTPRLKGMTKGQVRIKTTFPILKCFQSMIQDHFCGSKASGMYDFFFELQLGISPKILFHKPYQARTQAGCELPEQLQKRSPKIMVMVWDISASFCHMMM